MYYNYIYTTPQTKRFNERLPKRLHKRFPERAQKAGRCYIGLVWRPMHNYISSTRVSQLELVKIGHVTATFWFITTTTVRECGVIRYFVLRRDSNDCVTMCSRRTSASKELMVWKGELMSVLCKVFVLVAYLETISTFQF